MCANHEHNLNYTSNAVGRGLRGDLGEEDNQIVGKMTHVNLCSRPNRSVKSNRTTDGPDVDRICHSQLVVPSLAEPGRVCKSTPQPHVMPCTSQPASVPILAPQRYSDGVCIRYISSRLAYQASQELSLNHIFFTSVQITSSGH